MSEVIRYIPPKKAACVAELIGETLQELSVNIRGLHHDAVPKIREISREVVELGEMLEDLDAFIKARSPKPAALEVNIASGVIREPLQNLIMRIRSLRQDFVTRILDLNDDVSRLQLMVIDYRGTAPRLSVRGRSSRAKR